MQDLRWTRIVVTFSLSLAIALAAPGKPPASGPATRPAEAKAAPVDICTGVVDPYTPISQRTAFFKAAGPDSEIDAKEFTADWNKARTEARAKPPPFSTFARRFDRWTSLLAFDKNRNKTLDWFEADAYRRVRSFSSAFIVIQSRSPRSSVLSVRTSVCRRRAVSDERSLPSVLNRVLGRDGSSSRILRRMPSRPPSLSSFDSNGNTPAISSYSITPSE